MGREQFTLYQISADSNDAAFPHRQDPYKASYMRNAEQTTTKMLAGQCPLYDR